MQDLSKYMSAAYRRCRRVSQAVLSRARTAWFTRVRVAQDRQTHEVPVSLTHTKGPSPTDPGTDACAPDAMHTFLGRCEIDLSQSRKPGCYGDRVVLISGAGGSIGSEISRQILACKPRKVILFELSEPALYHIHRSMIEAASGTGVDIVAHLGSVTEAGDVRRVLHEHQVQVVLHAAAYKHVPLVECNPLAGLGNNVLGTQTLATEAAAAGVECFVLISSDKAVRPTGVMGASKRLAELVVQNISRRHGAQRGQVFSIVRFGNVLGSSGSVIPLFHEQLRRGGPLTVSHRDASRFFMTVQEAVHLVLCAGAMAQGGDIFVLDMGKPVKIEQLARRVIENSGLAVRDARNPGGDVDIVFTGLRSGEKLTEELTLNGILRPTEHPRIFSTFEDGLSALEFATALRGLRKALAEGDADTARAYACSWANGFGEPAASRPRVANG